MAVLANCAHSPPNIEACIRLLSGAACAYTIDGPDRDISEEMWKRIELGRISVSPMGWGAIRFFVEEVCAQEGACSDDWREKVAALYNKLPTEVE